MIFRFAPSKGPPFPIPDIEPWNRGQGFILSFSVRNDAPGAVAAFRRACSAGGVRGRRWLLEGHQSSSPRFKQAQRLPRAFPDQSTP
jgi:hypothetical protein